MEKIIDRLINSIKHSDVGKHMVISTISKPASMVVSYLYVPIVLNYLGVEKYGIWATILTILSWISYFDIGIGNGLRNKLTESLVNHDDNGRKLISSVYFFMSVLMIFAVVVFSAVCLCVNWNKIFGVTDINENLASLVILSVIFIAFNFVLSICKNVLYAMQKAGVVGLMELATQLVNLLGVFIAKFFIQGNLFVMSFVYGASMISVNLIASVIIYNKNKHISPSIRSIDMSVGKSVTNLGLKFFVIQICALVLFTTDSLIISYIYGAADVTPYNTVNKLFSALIGIYSAMIAPIWSSINKLNIEKKYLEINTTIKKLQVLMLPFVLMTVVLLFAFRFLSKIWLGQTLEYSNGLIIFGALYSLLSIWCNTYASISNGLEIMNASMWIAISQAIVNIPLSLYFAISLNMKSAGILAGTVASMLISAILQPLFVNMKIKERMKGDLF